MEEPQWFGIMINAISNLGFPIAITAYLLIRFEKKIESLNKSIIDLIQAIRDDRKK